MRILFFGKAGDPLAERAARYLETHAEEVVRHLGSRQDALPSVGDPASFDYIISYLSPWIIPARLLDAVREAAINFHPGPPEYPGIGCTNFALYEGADIFGITCHHMAPKVDTGAIIRVRRFPVRVSDSVLSLTERAHAAIAEVFYEIADDLLAGKPLPRASEDWTRRPFKRVELDALCRVTPEMEPEEIRRRVRATTYPGQPGAFVELAGHRFELVADAYSKTSS